MVFEIIAADAIATLTAYITKKASGKLGEKAEEIYQKVKEKLSSDSYAAQTLKNVEEDPTSKGGQAMLEEIMTKKMKADPVFAEEIKKLVNEAKEVPGSGSVIAYGDRSFAAGGDVNGTIVTGDNNNIHKP